MCETLQQLIEGLRKGSDEWLLLFDIDGTLVDTGGQGMSALRATATEIFGGDAPPLDLAGSTDLGIFATLRAHFEFAENREQTHEFFVAYHQNLEASLEDDPAEGRVLDGVEALLEDFSGRKILQLALLTGNTEVGAGLKLQHFCLNRYFDFGAFGSDRADRNKLGPIAVERAFSFTGKNYKPERILVIGDTPRDIACAHAMDARCLAVATGKFSAEELNAAGADWVIESMNELLESNLSAAKA